MSVIETRKALFSQRWQARVGALCLCGAAGLIPEVTLYGGPVFYQIILVIASGFMAVTCDPDMLEMGEREDA